MPTKAVPTKKERSVGDGQSTSSEEVDSKTKMEDVETGDSLNILSRPKRKILQRGDKEESKGKGKFTCRVIDFGSSHQLQRTPTRNRGDTQSDGSEEEGYRNVSEAKANTQKAMRMRGEDRLSSSQIEILMDRLLRTNEIDCGVVKDLIVYARMQRRRDFEEALTRLSRELSK
tara:strand:+ start:332 stop:850 length:519 start_codon:yes stop_codon:yes gene_type:complete